MRTSRSFVVVGALGLAASFLTACGENGGESSSDVSTGGSASGGSKSGEASGGSKSDDGSGGAEQSGGEAATGGESQATGGSGPQSEYPLLPSVLSLGGCEELEVGPLCTVTQDEGQLSANCSGLALSGSVDAEGVVKLVSEESKNDLGELSVVECLGELKYGNLRTASCVRTTSFEGVPDVTTSCELFSDPVILPGIACLELPRTLSDVVLCSEGADNGGETIDAGSCSVVQDGCVFQAECEDDRVLTGSVTATGVRFDQNLTALADAEGEAPAFFAGEMVSHSCSGELEGNSLTGSCSAGRAGRRGTDTSVCALSAGIPELPASCDNLAPTSEHLFVLDSCDLLKNGEGGADTGIGEPICAVRQNSCIWEVQCGQELVFSGRIAPADTKLSWQLATGTPCEASFDSEGKMSGSCQVAGELACPLSSKDPVPGGAECGLLPESTGFYGRGCGDHGGARLTCSSTMQHGCDFMATCAFAGPLLVAGSASVNEETSRERLDFNGLGDWQCHVEEASQSDVEADARLEGEWFGQCENSLTEGLCRDNYDAIENPTGFRGLQVFWGEPPVED